MNIEDLKKMSATELKKLAKEYNLEVSKLSKKEIINVFKENFELTEDTDNDIKLGEPLEIPSIDIELETTYVNSETIISKSITDEITNNSDEFIHEEEGGEIDDEEYECFYENEMEEDKEYFSESPAKILGNVVQQEQVLNDFTEEEFDKSLEHFVEEKTANEILGIEDNNDTPIQPQTKPKRDKFKNPYVDKKNDIEKQKKELSTGALKWLKYFELHFNGKDLLDELKNFKKFKSDKFRFKNELDELIEYLK